jgi:phosphoribosyl 1,2-cyclic phosphodiesterase
MRIEAVALQSGSNGNCYFIETAGVRLLIDAGLSAVDVERRLAARKRSPDRIDALIISHDHADHIRCAGILHRKFGVPLYVTPRTLEAGAARNRLGKLKDVRCFTAGDRLDFGVLAVRTIPTPHDGVDGVAFVIEAGGKRLGIMTDLGHVFDELNHEMADLDAVFLESNYDPDMLEHGPYPAFLRKRIRGLHGHISNREAAELLCRGPKLRWACLSHLSQHNNYPALALRTHRAIVPKTLPLHIASRVAATEVLTL